MRKKTIWTVVAGTSAAVLVPGVAYALVAGGASMPTEGPGIGNAGSDASVGDPSEQSVADAADLAIERAPDELAGSDGSAAQVPSPQQVPAVETLSSAGSPLSPISAMPAVTAVSALSAPSAQSPAPAQKTTTQRAPEAPKPSTTKQTPKQTSKETTKKAPAPKKTVQSAPSPVSAQSADSPDSPQSADDDD
ncbi:hypothetical protein ACT3SQ_17120 [Brachybacterium sp. AOP42-C2-15]|uniref:hypothetical protein n=1 Tax=unclassified Brachybacterium TaxID=2623841 RepID=UPI003F905D8B